MDKNNLSNIIRELLINLGQDIGSDGLKETPERVSKYYREILSGYTVDYTKFAKTFPNEGGRQLLTVRSIQFYSLCEHHMVPFFGKIAIGYIPDKYILGLSKFIRITEVFSKRLQVQERLTKQILEAINDVLEPRGCAVRIEAKHLCMSMRGVRNESSTVTQLFSGALLKDSSLQNQFLQSLGTRTLGKNDMIFSNYD